MTGITELIQRLTTAAYNIKLTRVGLALLNISPVPLTDTRATSVGKNDTANLFKVFDHTVSSNGSADLLGTGGNGELGLGGKTVGSGLPGNVGRSRHVLVRRVGARANETDLELLRPGVPLDLIGKLGEGSGKVRGEGTVDVGLELSEVDLNPLVILTTLVRLKVVVKLLGVLRNGRTVGGLEVAAHSVVEGEERGGGTNFSSHVTDGSHTGTRERLDTRTVVLNDSTSTTLDSEDTGNLEDNVY